MHPRAHAFRLAVLAILLICAKEAAAQQQTEALAKAAQNPVTAMIGVPFQNDTNFNVGPFSRAQNILNIQPVCPLL